MTLKTVIGTTLHIAGFARSGVLSYRALLALTHQARGVASMVYVCVERLETFRAEVAAAKEARNTRDGVKVADSRMVDDV